MNRQKPLKPADDNIDTIQFRSPITTQEICLRSLRACIPVYEVYTRRLKYQKTYEDL